MWSATPADVDVVTRLLGRIPEGPFRVVVRRNGRDPVVIENAPHLNDGTPMPTLYWLIDPELNEAVSRIEGQSGVHGYEDVVDPAALAASHDDYARRRAAATVRRDLIQASGGVGGTRVGVKCLHAHLANFLAGNVDPVGALVADEVDLPELEIVDVRA